MCHCPSRRDLPIQDIECALTELERRLNGAETALRREERRARWDNVLDRAATVVVLGATTLTFVAATAPLPSRVKGPFQVMNGNDTVFGVSARFATFGLYAPSGTIPIVARIGESTPEIVVLQEARVGIAKGKPTISIGDQKTAVSLTADADTPTMNLEANGVTMAEVGVGSFKAGHLLLTDASGGTVVDAGMTVNGPGAVQTYPNGGQGEARTFFGLPGTFICGVGCSR